MKKSILLVLLLLGVMTGQSQHLFEHTYPVITEEHAQIRNLMNKVSVDSLQATIEHLQSYHTRQWNSQMVYDVQDWLKGTYEAMDLDTVLLHDFPVIYHDSLCETSDNVIAVQRGTLYPDEYVVCGAHYDSYNRFGGDPDLMCAPGADDNASGVSGILETARLLSRCTFERSVIYCGFAAEEIGLVGSTAYARDCAIRMMDIVGYFNLDMIGYLAEGSDIHVNLLYRTRDSIIADYVYNFCDVYYPDMPVRQSWLAQGSDSDYSSFNRNGYASIQPFEDTHFPSPYIHTPDDILGLSVNNMDQVKRFTE
ncbi:MAG: M28 family peptidase, partial [Bacteroidales bacterium]|nr:M28 family peptidase [Bacteroidales bacterium]